jgi:hypothetical protein
MPKSMMRDTHCEELGPVQRSRQSGIGLIQAMMVIALVSVAAVIGVSTVAHQFKVRRAMLIKGQIADLRSIAQSRIDCQKTLITSGVDCSFDQVIPGLDAAGSLVIATPEQRYGGTLALRVLCGPSIGSNRLEIQYKMYNGATATALHPLSGQAMDWQSVTQDIPITCQ